MNHGVDDRFEHSSWIELRRFHTPGRFPRRDMRVEPDESDGVPDLPIQRTDDGCGIKLTRRTEDRAVIAHCLDYGPAYVPVRTFGAEQHSGDRRTRCAIVSFTQQTQLQELRVNGLRHARTRQPVNKRRLKGVTARADDDRFVRSQPSGTPALLKQTVQRDGRQLSLFAAMPVHVAAGTPVNARALLDFRDKYRSVVRQGHPLAYYRQFRLDAVPTNFPYELFQFIHLLPAHRANLASYAENQRTPDSVSQSGQFVGNVPTLRSVDAVGSEKNFSELHPGVFAEFELLQHTRFRPRHRNQPSVVYGQNGLDQQPGYAAALVRFPGWRGAEVRMLGKRTRQYRLSRSSRNRFPAVPGAPGADEPRTSRERGRLGKAESLTAPKLAASRVPNADSPSASFGRGAAYDSVSSGSSR